MESLWNRVACALITIVMLVGCGSLTSLPRNAADPTSQARLADLATGSWMLPEARSEDLLYVTNYSDVLVFSYPQGKLVGDLRGFYSTVGECVDSKGDVFITNSKPVAVYEYAHGGTKRINKFPTEKTGAVGCAINPVNGDLAVTGFTSYVDIFKGATGKPVAMRDKAMFFGQFCTYDDKGDLFFAGLKNPKNKLQLSELPTGATKFLSIRVDARFEPGDGIEWNGAYLTAVSYVPWPRGKAQIFRYAVKGAQATKSGQTPLDRPARTIVQYFIDGNRLIAPNIYIDSSSSLERSNVLFYNYPQGGQPSQTLSPRHLTAARGAVVSRAPSAP